MNTPDENRQLAKLISGSGERETQSRVSGFVNDFIVLSKLHEQYARLRVDSRSIPSQLPVAFDCLFQMFVIISAMATKKEETEIINEFDQIEAEIIRFVTQYYSSRGSIGAPQLTGLKYRAILKRMNTLQMRITRIKQDSGLGFIVEKRIDEIDKLGNALDISPSEIGSLKDTIKELNEDDNDDTE